MKVQYFIESINDKLTHQEIIDLYNSVNWTNYTNNTPTLLKAIENSLKIITARIDKKLIGLIRIVGDGHTIIYIQDILVLPIYQRKGIGKKLLKTVLDEYHLVRQKILLTDDNNDTKGFYESLGMKAVNELELKAYLYKND